jgi:hypothetical protein
MEGVGGEREKEINQRSVIALHCVLIAPPRLGKWHDKQGSKQKKKKFACRLSLFSDQMSTVTPEGFVRPEARANVLS